MPCRRASRASTLTSRSAPTCADSAASRARGRAGRPGRADAALAPHHQVGVAARQLPGELHLARRSAASRGCRSPRAARPRSAPGPPLCGRGAHIQTAPVSARAVATSPATAGLRDSGTATSTATAVLTSTTRKLTSHTPPTEASRSAGATCHWLAPSSPQGPPRHCQERASSPSASRTAADQRGRGRPRPAPRRAAAAPASPRAPTARRAAPLGPR